METQEFEDRLHAGLNIAEDHLRSVFRQLAVYAGQKPGARAVNELHIPEVHLGPLHGRGEFPFEVILDGGGGPFCSKRFLSVALVMPRSLAAWT